MPPICLPPCGEPGKKHDLSQRKRLLQTGADRGRRSGKSGQSDYFVGYKKHSLIGFVYEGQQRLNLPLVSLVRRASKADVEMLKPLLNFVSRQLEKDLPVHFIVGDKGYVSGHRRRFLSNHWHWHLIVAPKSDMKAPAGTESDGCPTCPMGERLTWFDYEAQHDLQLYRCESGACQRCQLSASLCSRQFEFPSSEHDTYWGAIPAHSRLSRMLRRHFRPRVETVFHEGKRRHGLLQAFLNSRDLTQQLCQASDSIQVLKLLVRKHALKPRQSAIAYLVRYCA